MRTTRIDELLKARKILLCVLGINLILSFSKLGIGLTTGALSLVAEGFHSLLDSSANAVAALGLTFSIKPPDKEHPYGHRKFEALSAIAISFFMFLASFEVLQEIIHRLSSKDKHEPIVSCLSYGIVILNILVNLLISRWEKLKSEELKSSLLLADSKHVLSDLWSSCAVLFTMIALHYRLHFVDIICSFVIVVIILCAGFEVIFSHLGPLIDTVVIHPEVLEKVVLAVPGVVSCHKIRSRGMEDNIFVDLHVQVESSITIEEAHKISYAVEAAVMNSDLRIFEVLVHLEDDKQA